MQKCSCNEQIFDLKYAKMSEVFITNIIPNVVMFPSQVQLNFNFYLKLDEVDFTLKSKTTQPSEFEDIVTFIKHQR